MPAVVISPIWLNQYFSNTDIAENITVSFPFNRLSTTPKPVEPHLTEIITA
jgi:hypothetical protein